jgi:hypothetical protein
MDILLGACGGIALASAILALLFLPRRAGSAGGPAGQVGAGETDVERAGLPL